MIFHHKIVTILSVIINKADETLFDIIPVSDLNDSPCDPGAYWWNAVALKCHYNAVNFLKNIHKWHPIASPLGRGMGGL